MASRVAVLIVVAGIFGGCSSPAPDDAGATTRTPASVAASATPSSTRDVPSVVFFEDDFSDPEGSWPHEDPTGPGSQGLNVGFEDGGFVMEAARGAKFAYMLDAPNETSANDVIVEVESTHSGQRAIYGVFCKADDGLATAYLFTLDSADTWAVSQMSRGRLEVIAEGRGGIDRESGATNHLRADCFQREPPPDAVAELRFWVNGTLVFRGRDPSGLGGQDNSVPGLFMESDFDGDTRVVFDNFVFSGVAPEDVPE